MSLKKAKERLNLSINSLKDLTSEKVLQISKEADEYIAIEQRERLKTYLVKLEGEKAIEKIF